MPDIGFIKAGFRKAVNEAEAYFEARSAGHIAFFWDWAEKNHPERFARCETVVHGATEEMTQVSFATAAAEWLAEVKALMDLYLAEASVRRFAPAFLSAKLSGGYSHAAEYFDMAVEKLEAWSASGSGFGGELPFAQFWAWFKLHKVYAKFAAMESEIEALLSAEIGPSDRRRVEELVKKWDESMRWAVGEFYSATSQRELIGA